MGSSWSYGSLIYNYICNQCQSSLMLRVWIPLRWGVLDTTLCDKICQWLATYWWFSPGTLVYCTNKTDCHDITEILLKVLLNTITLTPQNDKYFNILQFWQYNNLMQTWALWFSCSQRLLNYLVFKYFCYKNTWWGLFHKRVAHTKFDIYVLIKQNTG